jgi:hypothetical protein
VVNTEVYVEGVRLDVFDGMDFSFNYQVTDIRQPDTRSTEFSKTVRCPGTTANNTLFGHVFDVTVSNPFNANDRNVEVNFNPNKKAAVTVSVDTLPVFDGVVQLRRVVIVGDRIEYEVVMLGRLSNLFTRLADYKLNGSRITNEQDVVAGAPPIYAPYIDCSDLDHPYERPTIINTWTAPIGEGIVYPLIDYGTNTLFYNDGRRVYHVEDLRPAIYLKDLIDRIFAYAQSTYESVFLNSNGFKRLVVPLTKAPRLEDDTDYRLTVEKGNALQNLHSKQLLTTGQPFTFGNHSCFIVIGPNAVAPAKVCFEVETNDPVNQWVILDTPTQIVNGTNFNPAAGQYEYQIYQLHRRDTYRATVNLRIWYNSNVNGSGAPASGLYKQRLEIVHYSAAGGFSTIVGSTEFEWNMAALFAQSSVGTGPFPAFQQAVTVEAVNIDTFGGDAVYVQIAADGPDGFGSDYGSPISNNTLSYVGYQIEGGSFVVEPNTENLLEGGTYVVTKNLPDVTMKDVLISTLRMFNLQLVPSKDRPDHYIIQTWDEFYASGTLRDWTYKLDHQSPIELIPMGLLAAREYLFKYSEDGDYYNSRYQSTHGRTYGSRRFEVDNDFVPKRTEVSVVFSPTPLNNDHGSNRLIPKIYDADISEGAQPTDANIRVVYYAGLLPSNPAWRFRSGYPPAVNLDITVSQYPYAGHLNNPYTPTFDLSWGIPFELYYSTNAYITTLFYTNSNLFNEYHLRQYREIVDKDSKLMIGYFYLTPLDIEKLDFRDTVIIDGVYWRLNRVMDYNPFKAGLTKVELLKVMQLDPFTKTDLSLTGRGGGGRVGKKTIEIEGLPEVKDSLEQKGRNYAPTFQGTVKGTGNEIDGTANAFNVLGSDNVVEAGTYAVTITGNGNRVKAGLHNVTILNTTGYIATRSNVTVINGGEVVLFGGIIEGGENEVRALTAASPIMVIDGGENTVTDIYAEYHNDIN